MSRPQVSGFLSFAAPMLVGLVVGTVLGSTLFATPEPLPRCEPPKIILVPVPIPAPNPELPPGTFAIRYR